MGNAVTIVMSYRLWKESNKKNKEKNKKKNLYNYLYRNVFSKMCHILARPIRYYEKKDSKDL